MSEQQDRKRGPPPHGHPPGPPPDGERSPPPPDGKYFDPDHVPDGSHPPPKKE